MPRFSTSGKSATAAGLSSSRGSSPQAPSPLSRTDDNNSPGIGSYSKNNLTSGMPAEHSTPQPSIMVEDSTDGKSIAFNPKIGNLEVSRKHGSSAGLSSLASFAGSFLTSNTEEATKRQKLEKYKKRLRENLAEQEMLVNKRIAAAANVSSNMPSQRSVREFEQKIHVLAGKAQKLGRSIAALESQLASMPVAPHQPAGAGETGQTNFPARTSQSVGAGKTTSVSTSNNSPPNAQLLEQQQQPSANTNQPGLLQHTASSSSSHHSQTPSVPGGTTSQQHVPANFDSKSSTLPAHSHKPFGVFRDVKESITSTFRLRPSTTNQGSLSGADKSQRKYGSADNLHQLNLSNASTSTGSCETAGSGAIIAPTRDSQGQTQPNSSPPTAPHHSVSVEKTKSANHPAAASHTGVSSGLRPPPGEKNAGTLPASNLGLRSSTSFPHFNPLPHGKTLSMPIAESNGLLEQSKAPQIGRRFSLIPSLSNDYSKSFKYATTGDVEDVLGQAAAVLTTPGVSLSPEEVSLLQQQQQQQQLHQTDETASQMTTGSGQLPALTPFSNSYHFHSPPSGYTGVVLRELKELKELKSEMENLRNQLQMFDRHWNEKMENLRVELTDVKYLLHTKPSRDDILTVNRRCEEYLATSNEAIEHLRNDVIFTKSELSRQDQDLDNTIERLRRRVEEMDFDAVATRLTLVEAKVSQVSNYVPGPEPSLRNVAAKLLNVLFALVALFLLLISTAVSMAAPFIRTRIRIIFSALLALLLAVLYHFWLWRLFADDRTLQAPPDPI